MEQVNGTHRFPILLLVTIRAVLIEGHLLALLNLLLVVAAGAHGTLERHDEAALFHVVARDVDEENEDLVC